MSGGAVGGEMILATVMEGGGNGNKDEFLYLAVGTVRDGVKDDTIILFILYTSKYNWETSDFNILYFRNSRALSFINHQDIFILYHASSCLFRSLPLLSSQWILYIVHEIIFPIRTAAAPRNT